MIILNVFVSLKPEQEAVYLEDTKSLVEASRAEEGNHFYTMYKQVDAKCEYIIVEHWQNQAAIDFHNATSHFQAFVANVEKYVSKPLRIEKYEG